MAKKKISVNSEAIRRLDRAMLMRMGRSGTVRSSSNGSMAKVIPILFSALSSISCARARISSWNRGKLRAKCGRSTKISRAMPAKIAAKKTMAISAAMPNGRRSCLLRSTTRGSIRYTRSTVSRSAITTGAANFSAAPVRKITTARSSLWVVRSGVVCGIATNRSERSPAVKCARGQPSWRLRECARPGSALLGGPRGIQPGHLVPAERRPSGFQVLVELLQGSRADEGEDRGRGLQHPGVYHLDGCCPGLAGHRRQGRPGAPGCPHRRTARGSGGPCAPCRRRRGSTSSPSSRKSSACAVQ